jgi:hypothetical protein
MYIYVLKLYSIYKDILPKLSLNLIPNIAEQ